MSAPRLLLPGGAALPVSDLRVVPLNRLASGGRWRTEAMRSYSSPVLLWFTRGQGRVTVAGVTSGYGPHNAIFLPAHIMHGFDMLGHVFGSAVFLPRDARLQWPEAPLHLRLRDGRAQAEMTGLIDTLERESKASDMAGHRAVFHQVGLLSVVLERLSAQPELQGTARKETAADRLAGAFASLVERDYRTPKSIAAYAAELGVTATHLTRACKKSCGRGALEIVADRKLYEARQRLAEGAEPVKDIARSLGFASAAYFTRAFRLETGQSPTEFRRSFA